MEREPIRVVVVDDHSMVRGGLRLFLMAFDDMALVGEAPNGLEALQVCEQAQPHVVLMDLIMPVMDGIHATRELHERQPQVRVIGLTSFLQPDLVQEAIQAGMTGLLSKDVSASELAHAIREARAGRPAFSGQVAELLKISEPSGQLQAADRPNLPGPSDPPPAAQDFTLTSREREVLALMANGASNADIAQRLVVSLSTAKYHVSSILEKLHVANRAEAVALALQHRLIEGRAGADK